MLYLFDIDGTLVDTGGAGMKSLQEANSIAFGHDGPALDLAGSTDLSIIARIHAHFEVESTPERIAEYFEIYHKRLDWNLTHGGFPGRVYEGASLLLDELTRRNNGAIGLLTGNTATGAACKMRHFGLADYFKFGAYGCDHADRNRLGPIALERAAIHAGQPFAASKTIVIGDTPKDIDCAHAMGAKCIAVATGSFTTAALSAHGADYVVESLADTLQWI